MAQGGEKPLFMVFSVSIDYICYINKKVNESNDADRNKADGDEKYS